MESLDVIKAKEKAVKYIGISKKTKYEVVKKLKSLGIDSFVIDKATFSLEDLGYIDDKDYCRLYVKQCKSGKKYSIYEIKQKLLQKGINIDIIEEELNKSIDTNYEKEVVKKLLATKLKNYDKCKQIQYLYRRGLKSNIEQY